eukprot:TRINITY_DN6782_c0_g1_i1.p1 TRINITY_DN6782_c0_g1~~TRINITY_DN6782_c0_g1_i1.p1  ORF type:complete len:338 (+),score=82.21 TRINITY_DN6782_c0_g1_i1:101-1114(+)
MNVPLKALFDFKGDAKEHKINIKQGEQIELIEPSNEHWWRGRNSSNEAGFFPKSYVKIDGTEYHVMHTFTPEKENLETQIVVNEGETVHVVEKSNDLWWRGVSKRYKSGFFPAAFVCPMSEAKELQKRNSLKASKIETKEASETVKKESEVKIINSSNSQTVNKANKQRHSSILHQTGTAMLNKSPNTTFKPPIILQTGGGLKKPTLSNRPKSKQTSFNSNTRQSHLSVQLAKLSIETVDQELQRSSSTGNINESDEEDEFEIIQRTQRDGSVIVENPLSNPVPKKFPERRNSKRMSRNSLPTRRMSLPNGNRAFSALLQNKMMERISGESVSPTES